MQRAAGETCRIHTVLQKGVSILLFKVRKWGKKDNVKRSGNNSFFVRKIENWFSERLPRMGAKKKLVARILKSEPLILKSKPLIFCVPETRLKTVRKTRTNKARTVAAVPGGRRGVGWGLIWRLFAKTDPLCLRPRERCRALPIRNSCPIFRGRISLYP